MCERANSAEAWQRDELVAEVKLNLLKVALLSVVTRKEFAIFFVKVNETRLMLHRLILVEGIFINALDVVVV